MGPCSRCQIICIDQQSGERNKEILQSLSAARGRKVSTVLQNSCNERCSDFIAWVVQYLLSKYSHLSCYHLDFFLQKEDALTTQIWFISIKCSIHFLFRNGLLLCIIFNCACFYSVCTYSVFILVLKAQADALMSFKKRNMLKNQKVFEIIQLACHTKLYSYPEKLVNRKNRADVNIVKVESNCLGK